MRYSSTPQPSQDNVSVVSDCPSNDIDSNDNFSNNFNDQLDEISTDPLSDVSLNNISEKNAAENEKLLKASFVDLDAPARNKVQFKVLQIFMRIFQIQKMTSLLSAASQSNY